MPNRLFEWDDEKDLANQDKHNVTFAEATFAFDDPYRLIIVDKRHSKRGEKRYFCIGRVRKGILTVRFTYRNGKIRIFGAGFWREGKIHMNHEQNNELEHETVVYTDEPLEFGEVVVDFLPSPAEVAKARSQVFVRIALDVDTLAFFKQMAKKQKISHRAVLENLLESYAQRKIHANHILEAVTG